MTGFQDINSSRMREVRDEPKLLYYGVSFNQEVKLLMLNHNVISSNQLADWKETTESVYDVDNYLNNYYECLIDAGDDTYTARRCSRLIQ